MIKTIFIEPKARIAMIATLLGGACFLTYYFHVLLRSEVVFTHFFYIPIILASLWWQKKGLWVAIFLATLLIVSHNFFRVEVLTANDYLRAAMFIVIAFIIAVLSERMAKAGEELRKKTKIVGEITDAVITTDLDGNITSYNTGAERMYGYKAQEVIGKPVSMFYLAEDMPQLVSQIGEIVKGNTISSIEARIIGENKKEVPVILSLAPVKDSEGNVIELVGVAKDITERKRTEETLKESEERYRSLVNLGGAVGEAIVMLRDTEQGDAIQTFVSKDWPRITGYSEKELLGISFFDLLSPKYHQASLKRHKRRMRGEAIPELLEMSIIRKDGAEVPIELTSAHTTYKGERANVAFIRDITERKRAEKEEKELMAALKRSNEELQRFAHVASHDLQEPLRMVASFTQLLAQRYRGKLDKDADEFIGYAVDGANRMQALLNGLLTYSRVKSRGKPFAPTDFEHILSQAQDNLMVAIKENKAKITHDPLPTVMGDATQLVQLVQNLLDNAIKFRGKESLQVHVSAKQENNEWVFSVRDNGIGIAPEYFDRIFVIFQRLHGREEYPGTGTGLAVCKRIVERHQGRIWVKSQPGKGSTFYFTIPRGGDK